MPGKAKQINLSDLITYLSDLRRIHGNLPCVYAHDEEGNGYSPCVFKPSAFRLENGVPGPDSDGDTAPNCILIN